MLPTLVHEDGIYTFTLWRDGKKVVHTLKGFCVGVHSEPEDGLQPSLRAKVDGPSFDGILYYIWVEEFNGDENFIWISKNEFELLDAILIEITEDLYESQSYEFTRTTLNDMAKNPTKYGPEQLARAMMWIDDESDIHDAYREHPLDHE